MNEYKPHQTVKVQIAGKWQEAEYIGPSSTANTHIVVWGNHYPVSIDNDKIKPKTSVKYINVFSNSRTGRDYCCLTFQSEYDALRDYESRNVLASVDFLVIAQKVEVHE